MEKLTKPQKTFYDGLLAIKTAMLSFGSPEKFAESMCIIKDKDYYTYFYNMYRDLVNSGILTVTTLNGHKRNIMKALAEKDYIRIINSMHSYEMEIIILEVKEND